MIFRTHNNRAPLPGVTLLPMPWLEHWEAMASGANGDHMQRVGQRVRGLRMWRQLDWQPEAANAALGWIATGYCGTNSVVLGSTT